MQHSLGGMLSVMSSLAQQKPESVGIEGVIVAGSYVPSAGTVQVVMAHTVAAAAFQDPGGKQIFPTTVGAQLSAEGYGDQYGPVGGERCILRRNGTHFTATLEHNGGDGGQVPSDSPGAPSGERWSLHYVPDSVPTGVRTVNAYWKLTNDGATTGDGLGGFKALLGGLGSLVTGGGINLSLNDTANLASLTGAATVNLTTTGGASINMAGSVVKMNGAPTSAANGVVRQEDLVTFLAALQTALTTWASSNLQGGSGAGGPTLAFTPPASTATYTT